MMGGKLAITRNLREQRGRKNWLREARPHPSPLPQERGYSGDTLWLIERYRNKSRGRKVQGFKAQILSGKSQPVPRAHGEF